MVKTPPASPKLLKPVDHVVLAFAEETAIRDATTALNDAGFAGPAVHEYTADEMRTALDVELENAGPLASLGQETNLAKFRGALAEEGHGWLVVHAPNDEQTDRVADIARRFGARLAQKFNRFTIDELL